MLAVVQYPLVDLRSFLPQPTGRLAKPVYPITDPPQGRGRDWFVRGVGAVRSRFSGGVDEWVAEDYFCDASRLVRMNDVPLADHAFHSARRIKSYVAFRRMFWDGRRDESPGAVARPAPVVGRIDIGLGIKGRAAPHWLEFSGKEVDQLLQGILSEKAYGPWLPKQTGAGVRGDELGLLGPTLARSVLRATTEGTARAQTEHSPWWLQAARPAMLIDYAQRDEIESFPKHARALELPPLLEMDVALHFYPLRRQGATVPVWFIGHQLKHHGRDTRSRLRRCLTRINAEVAALQVVARMVSDPTFRAVIEQPQAQYFRHYVKSSIGGILADQRYGLSQMTLTDLVLWAMETAAPGEFTNLRSLFGTLDQSARHVSERFLNRVDANSGADPLVLEYDFFLAHSSKDKDISESLSALLRAKSAKVYLDSESLEPGDIWPDALQAAQKRSRITLALVSAHSVKSHWFKSECVTAIELANSGRKHLLVPIMLDASEMPYGTNIVQGIALYAGVTHDEAVDKLVKKLADMGA